MMKAKEASAGKPLSNPGKLPHVSDNSTVADEGKKVSVAAVKSVAGQYCIDSDLFKEWLESRGFQIQEEA